MEYNNYYPGQPGHPPPPVNNQQQMQQQQPPPGGQMMHAPMPPHNIRQAMPPGPPGHHQQMQIQQQHLGHHPQQMPPQQQHQGYHQIQGPHPHGPPVSHSGSPHPQQPLQQQQQQQQHHNHHQPGVLPPHQQPGLPQQHPHMHPQSPHSHNGPPQMHMQQQPQMNQMVRPNMNPAVMNHQQPGLQQPPPHHHQNFFSGGAIPHSNPHHYPQQNQHQAHHQPQHHHQQQQQQHHHHHHQPQLIHHPAPPPITHHPHIQQSIGRMSPCPSICQTEFRIIELNRWLQSRPIFGPISPLPNNHHPDESRWWEKFAFEFFEDDATLTLRIQDDKQAEYTIGRTLIPRFFRTCFDGGVTDLSFNLRNPKETFLHPHPQSMITLDCDQAFIVSIYRHPSGGTVVHTEGHLTVDFVCSNNDNLSIKSWRFITKGCREYIDRTMTTMGHNVYLAEPITRQGLTKSTISYLKMCMIMEPMQEIMSEYRRTRADPRTCLRKYLAEHFKYSSTTDNRAGTKAKRKRKSSAAPPIAGPAAPTTNKRTKANLNNPIGNNSGLNNNVNMSPSGIPSFSLASQDVMVVGEPSMMGGDFGDDNERMITRLENTQYDPTASTPSNPEESDSMNASVVNENTNSNGNNIDQSIDSHTMSPSLLQQRQQQHQQQQPPPPPPQQLQQQQPQQHQQLASPVSAPQNQVLSQQQNQLDQSSPRLIESQQQSQQTQQIQQQAQHIPMSIQDQSQEVPVTDHTNHEVNLIDNQEVHAHNETDQHQLPQSITEPEIKEETDQQMPQQENLSSENFVKQEPATHEDIKVNTVSEALEDSSLMLGMHSVDHAENHTGSIQPLNDESNSNSQLPCATASTTNPTMSEQQQPVDNGVA